MKSSLTSSPEMTRNISQITQNLIKLQQAYSSTFRAMVTGERYKNLIESGLIKDFSYDSEFIREPLIEHVGHLPIIASYLHSYIEHRDKVDLGRALIMLSVHDIGETEVGDVLTYSKPDISVELESEAARKLLPDYLYKYFEEIEKRETLDAKFAKAVDSIAPILHEMVLPKVTLERFKHHNFDVKKIIAKKKEHFEWDGVLLEIFEYLIGRYRQMEKHQ
jgi:putative hydrolase of HD superfamily